MEELTQLQNEIRQSFYELCRGVPESLAVLEEQVLPVKEVRSDIDSDDLVLILKLVPRRSEVCPMTILVYPEDCHISYATESFFDLNPWMLAPVVPASEYAETVRKYIRAILEGNVQETVWMRGSRVVGSKSVLQIDDTPITRSTSNPISFFIGVIKRDVERKEISYKPIRDLG